MCSRPAGLWYGRSLKEQDYNVPEPPSILQVGHEREHTSNKRRKSGRYAVTEGWLESMEPQEC